MLSPSRRSVYTGDLTIDDVSIPVAIYKARDCYELPGNLYHTECHGKVRQLLFCEEHPNDEEIATFSGITIGDQVVPLDAALKDVLLGRKAKMEALGSHRLADLPTYISTTCLVPLEMYELTGQRSGDLPINLDGSHDAIATFLERLRVKRRFLRVKIGLGGLTREAILLPSGHLYTLSYAEELREQIGVDGKVNRELGRRFDALLEALDGPLYQPSLAEIDSNVTNWFISMARRIKNASKKTGKKVLTNA